MKKEFIFTLMALLGSYPAVAQWDSTDYLPIVREGVKWVNEKVIINHGDTTRYYYCYEFSGIDSTEYYTEDIIHACYYYTDGTLDVDSDSLIAGLIDRGAVSFYRNNAYERVHTEGRTLFRLASIMEPMESRTVLYWFSDGHSPIDYYLTCQEWDEVEPPVLTRENFTEVEPIEVEGTTCRRYAYVKENGDTMCYVVEGIGFDSRNMGDLLTPFTREPDPDADYQEYCGLCHVVKDGQIIYKGMRYTPDNMTGIDEVVAEQRPRRVHDDNYYNLMGQPVGKTLPTAPGIYIHQGKKIVIR